MPVISLSPSFLPKPALSASSVADGSRPSASHRSRVFAGLTVLGHVEDVGGVERVALRVQPVTRVLDERDQILREESDVVEACVRGVALVQHRELAGVGRRIRLRDVEHAGPPAAAVVLGAGRVRVARLVEVELREVRVGTEDPVSGRLNGVPWAAFARAFAVNGALPLTAVSWIVIHFVLNTLP